MASWRNIMATPIPINQVANGRPRMPVPFRFSPGKNMLQLIERAITMANIGINPQNDGTTIRLFLPR